MGALVLGEVHTSDWGAAKQVDRIEIRWPSGIEQVMSGVHTNQVLQVTEPAN